MQSKSGRERVTNVMLAFATGGLLGDVFFHTLPHMSGGHSHDHSHEDVKVDPLQPPENSAMEDHFEFIKKDEHHHHHHDNSAHEEALEANMLIIVGIIVFFLIEKLTHSLLHEMHSHGDKDKKVDEK